MNNADRVERLNEIKDEIAALVEEAAGLADEAGGTIGRRARSYWYGHILGALDHEGSFGGSSMHALSQTIEEVEQLDSPCPTCGCKPGQGPTPGCDDPLGCDYDPE